MIEAFLIASTIETVPATSTIYPNYPLDGTLPIQVQMTEQYRNNFISFYAEGSVKAAKNLNFAGPDGNFDTLNDTEINPFKNFSGITMPSTLPLVGMFYNKEYMEVPSSLNYYDDNISYNFLKMEPDINQVFFIGDGYTDNGELQQFMVPSDATDLFLGFIDAPYFTGDPGAYQDNEGFFTVSIFVPSPSSLMLLLSGMATIYMRKRK